MSQRIDKSWVVFASVENADHDRCVDVFWRPDGSFGFEEFRRDVEDGGRWTPMRYCSGVAYGSADEAYAAAERAVDWLREVLQADPGLRRQPSRAGGAAQRRHGGAERPWSSLPLYESLVSAVSPNASVDPKEVERFAALAGEWWDAAGPFAPLHRFNPVRLAWMREALLGEFGGDPKSLAPLGALRVLDIGCGGGLLAEPLTRLGAQVTAIDPAAESVEAARLHAEAAGLSIDYRAVTAEELAAAGETFDAVIASEVVEHVADVEGFVGTVAALTRPGGMALFTTLNRTLRAFAFAIIGAEYVLRWLPRGTHRFDRLVKPEELAAACRDAGLLVGDRRGFVYEPVRDTWRLSERDLAINYGLAATRPEAL